MEEEKMENKKKRICRRELFLMIGKNQNSKSIKEDMRESTSFSLLQSLSLFLHKFYATCALRLEEVVLVEL
jgi:hypothetical protein